ncbi:MAG: flagellar motor switch protein FliG [Treponema sp.]|jgi:flagellar motor switch protein FliG|nr:flagellar motor switch protein FliG [Treponema sp.]
MAKSKGAGGSNSRDKFFNIGKNREGSIRNRSEYTGFWDDLEDSVAHRADVSGEFFKTTDNQKSRETKESKYRKVAKFLILIGSEDAAKILAQLEPPQVEVIAREVASIKGISQEEAEEILSEFRMLLASSYGLGGLSQGGIEAARKLLYEAFGPEKGEVLLHNSVPDSRGNPFAFLDAYSGGGIAALLRDESPAAAALILSRLTPELSAATLAHIPQERKLEIVVRIARLEQTSPEVLERVASALREKIRHLGQDGRDSEIDGMTALTAILKHSDISFGDKILEELADHDPNLTKDLKDRLYTLEDVIKAEDRPLQEKLRSMSDRDIVLLLKGRSDDFTQKICSNLSSNRRSHVLEEASLIGKVPKKEADAVARDFLTWFRTGREEGRIIIMDSEDVIV